MTATERPELVRFRRTLSLFMLEVQDAQHALETRGSPNEHWARAEQHRRALEVLYLEALGKNT
jgi:hypothetical protein